MIRSPMNTLLANHDIYIGTNPFIVELNFPCCEVERLGALGLMVHTRLTLSVEPEDLWSIPA